MNQYYFTLIWFLISFFIIFFIVIYQLKSKEIKEFDENFDRSKFKAKKIDAHVLKYNVHLEAEKKRNYLK